VCVCVCVSSRVYVAVSLPPPLAVHAAPIDTLMWDAHGSARHDVHAHNARVLLSR